VGVVVFVCFGICFFGTVKCAALNSSFALPQATEFLLMVKHLLQHAVS
jgi:hypothetical protein